MGRAAGDVEIYWEHLIGAVALFIVADVWAAGDGAGAYGDDDLGGGDGGVGFFQGELTGSAFPSSPPPATKEMPNRSRSQPTVLSTLVSASQAPQPPADTWRSLRLLPNNFRSLASMAGQTCLRPLGTEAWHPVPSSTRSARLRAAMLYSRVNFMALLEQAFSHAPQKRHLPRSKDGDGSVLSAPVGQTLAQPPQWAWHLATSNSGRPRNRAGSSGGAPAGYFIVRCPCRNLADNALNIESSREAANYASYMRWLTVNPLTR